MYGYEFPEGNDRGSLSGHSGESTIIPRDAIGNSARSSFWSVLRSGVAGREAAGAGGGGRRSGTVSDRVTGDDRELSAM